MKTLKYRGSFVSKRNNRVRVELWVEALEPCIHVQELRFPAEEPLRIQWSARAKYEAVEKSRATLRIISPGDRTYTDLYTDAVAATRMDVYIDDSLWWSGTLDPEQYEEPYEQLQGYEVELTFSDFAVLDRMDFAQWRGLRIGDVLNMCVKATKINHNGWNFVTTTTVNNGHTLEFGVLVDGSNWIDNDGESRSMMTALEDILVPLGMKIRQRAGYICVFDINGLAHTTPKTEAWWSGTEQTLSADRVYHMMKLRWETYVRSGNMLPEKPWGDEPDPEKVRFSDTGTTDDGCVYWSIPAIEEAPTGLSNYSWAEESTFTLWTRALGYEGMLDAPLIPNENVGARLMITVKQNGGTQQQGVALRWTPLHLNRPGNIGATMIEGASMGVGMTSLFTATSAVPDRYLTRLLSTRATEVPMSAANERMQMVVKLPLLLSGRAALWGDSEWKDHDAEAFEAAMKSGILYVPVRIALRGDDGRNYVWSNRQSLVDVPSNRGRRNIATISDAIGEWVVESDEYAVTAWLAYYDPQVLSGDGSTHPCVESFAVNRPAINPANKGMTAAVRGMEGQVIPAPPCTGSITIDIVDAAWLICEPDTRYGIRNTILANALRTATKWLLTGVPSIEPVRRSLYNDSMDVSDVEYNILLNDKAEEDLEIETRIGCGETEVPGARGALYDVDTGVQVRSFTRGGVSGRLEELLGRTMRCNYGTRKTRISGEARLEIDALPGPWTEQNQEGRRFLLESEDADLIEMTSDITLVEITEDYGEI